MDPLTQAALGATVGLAGFRRSLGRRAIAAGAAVALLPDADVVAGWIGGPFANWLYHRGLTHSVFFGIVAGPPLGWVLWRLDGWWRARRGEPPAAAAAWIGLAAAALLTHPLIDLVTHYGTQMLAPFSDHRFAVPAMPVIDPVFTLILLAAVAVGVAARRRIALARGVGWAALAACWAYVLFAWSINDRVADEARRQLAAEGRPAARVAAYPTIFQPYLRRIVAHDDGEVLIGFHSVLAPARIDWLRLRPDSGPAVAAAAATPEAAIFAWFADGQLLWQVENGPGRPVVQATDLRYGFPDGSETGLWGIRAPLGPDDRPTAPPSVFSARPAPSPDRLKRLWELVFG